MRILGNGFIICDVETCMNREEKIIMKVNFIEFCNQIKIVTKCVFACIPTMFHIIFMISVILLHIMNTLLSKFYTLRNVSIVIKWHAKHF